ncbi:MAG: glucose-6-phosphate dehydrogenase [Armatimonadota bacterium]
MTPNSEPVTPAEPHLFVVLGGSGDLMRTKLLPALWHLTQNGYLKAPSQLVAVGRRSQFDDESYAEWARKALTDAGFEPEGRTEHWCEGCLHYQSLGEEKPEDFERLAERLRQLEQEHGLSGNRVFYLAIPPQSLPQTVQRLGDAGLHQSEGWTRLVVEKPFGSDLDSARSLDQLIGAFFSEEQIYRIDHYLGKEAVQNLLVFRFANSLFESVWNREHVSAVEITVAETGGTEGRATYYDGTGAIRDMLQNHLTQLMTLTAMEAPPAYDADSVRDEKAKVLRSIPEISISNVVLGQYTKGTCEGEPCPGYLEDEGVAPDSKTPTFVAAEVRVHNWRWNGVPFYLRTGKRLPQGIRRIAVNFHCPPLALFDRFDDAVVHPNALTITIEPNEGFELTIDVKAPGDMLTLREHRLQFRYGEAYEKLPEAYEALLLDVLHGDQTLFVRIDEVLEAWRLCTPLLNANLPLYPYEAGTWGPKEAERLGVPVGGVCFL